MLSLTLCSSMGRDSSETTTRAKSSAKLNPLTDGWISEVGSSPSFNGVCLALLHLEVSQLPNRKRT